MPIEVRPVARLRGPDQAGAADAIASVLRAAADSTADLATLRLHYLMGDYSPHVLGRARQAVAHHGAHVTSLVVDATHPGVSLGFLRGKAFLVYISNVYDNLPTDEVARRKLAAMAGGAAQVRAAPKPAAY